MVQIMHNLKGGESEDTLKRLVAIVIALVFGVMLISALSNDRDANIVPDAQTVRAEIETVADYFETGDFDDVGEEEFKTRGYVGDQLARVESSIATIALEDAGLYLDFIAREARQQRSNDKVFEAINRVQSALAAGHVDQALQLTLQDSLNDDERQKADAHLEAAKEFNLGLLDIVRDLQLEFAIENQIALINQAQVQLAVFDEELNVREVRDGQINVLERTGAGTLGMVSTINTLMNRAQVNLGINRLENVRTDTRAIADLVETRRKDAAGDTENVLRDAHSALRKVSDELTVETGLSASQLNDVFTQTLQAMAQYEAFKAANTDINEDPRLVGIHLTATAEYVTRGQERSNGALLDITDEQLERIQRVAELLLSEGVDAVSNEEVQAVYATLQDSFGEN